VKATLWSKPDLSNAQHSRMLLSTCASFWNVACSLGATLSCVWRWSRHAQLFHAWSLTLNLYDQTRRIQTVGDSKRFWYDIPRFCVSRDWRFSLSSFQMEVPGCTPPLEAGFGAEGQQLSAWCQRLSSGKDLTTRVPATRWAEWRQPVRNRSMRCTGLSRTVRTGVWCANEPNFRTSSPSHHTSPPERLRSAAIHETAQTPCDTRMQADYHGWRYRRLRSSITSRRSRCISKRQ
jgi:hypothetical protein